MYDTILVGTDGSETATLAVQRAASVAASVGATLIIASAYEPVSEKDLEAQRRQAPGDIQWAINPRERVDQVLADAGEKAAATGATRVETKAIEGSATASLLDLADSAKATLIVVGSVGLTGAKRFLLGSVPNRIVHHSGVDVLVVRTA